MFGSSYFSYKKVVLGSESCVVMPLMPCLRVTYAANLGLHSPEYSTLCLNHLRKTSADIVDAASQQLLQKVGGTTIYHLPSAILKSRDRFLRSNFFLFCRALIKLKIT